VEGSTVKVRIEFAAEDRPPGNPQILWADMPRKDYEGLKKQIAAPDAADRTVKIPSRIDGSRETRDWMFRLSLIKVTEA
jgi:hypothetical protein